MARTAVEEAHEQREIVLRTGNGWGLRWPWCKEQRTARARADQCSLSATRRARCGRTVGRAPGPLRGYRSGQRKNETPIDSVGKPTRIVSVALSLKGHRAPA